MKIRNCPNCGSEIKYKWDRWFKEATKKNKLCKPCALKKTNEENVKSGKLKGKNHPFFGKKFSKEYRKKISECHWDSSGDKNPMFGKSFYECWVVKYGKEIADKKLIEFKEKQSKLNRGKNNKMFGKPAPQGSGNGWSGWYKEWYFRSLLELSYMIKVIERFNLKWKSAECKELAIPYTNWDGKQKTYFADFLINNKYLVECKPKKLHNTPSVLSKSSGAKTFSKKRELTYKLRTVKLLEDEDIKQLHNSGEIKFLPKYEEKFQKRCKLNLF